MFSNTAMTVEMAAQAHEDEEQRSPEAPKGHIVEYVGEGDEDEARTGIRVDAESKTRRKNNQPGHEGYECIKCDDAEGFSGKRAGLVDIAAKKLPWSRRRVQE